MNQFNFFFQFFLFKIQQQIYIYKRTLQKRSRGERHTFKIILTNVLKVTTKRGKGLKKT